jgi:ceramide glucosyltransferase
MIAAIAIVGLAGLALSAAIYGISAAALLRLRKSAERGAMPGFAPPVSIVKPLCGVDEELEANLESFFRLDYETFEVVFSFASAQDPAYRIARAIADRHPEVASTFVFDAREPGGNAKVNRLAAALRFARHRLILFSDGNVRVRSDFLRLGIGWFADPKVGLVSHLFRAVGSVSLGSRVESLYLNGCLQPGTALVAGILRIPCVVGKSILISKRALEAIGGVTVLRDHLAEDFLLGREVRRAGYQVALSADVIDTAEVGKGAKSAWERHRRWAMMRRRLAGPLYAGELLTSALPWFLAAMTGGSPGLRLVAGVLLGLRWGIEATIARLSGRPLSWRDAALLPVRDLCAAALFWAGLAGRSVSWRGRELVIGKQTRILRKAA